MEYVPYTKNPDVVGALSREQYRVTTPGQQRRGRRGQYDFIGHVLPRARDN